MKVIRAGVLGFCKGVRRAVEMARQVSIVKTVKTDETDEAASSAGTVYTLGPLIHNSRILESLEELGVICLEGGEIPAASENSVVIIRAHGVSPLVEGELARRGVTIVDATCPHVKISQGKARDFAERGYTVFLAGEENHAEIEGLLGYAQDGGLREGQNCFVVVDPLEAAAAAEELCRRTPQAKTVLKTVLIGQTTISRDEYGAIGEKIRQFFPSLETIDSICGATAERQKALRELCGKVEAVIIAGSRESANTQRLLSLALELGKPAWLAETQADLPAEIGIYKTVGISAGASTPEDLIDEIEEALNII